VRKSSAIWLSIAAILCLVVLSSPFYLELLAGFKRADWTEIGNIGQAYGAASAILSALALLGIAVSVRLQVREHFANRHQIVRTQHFRLLELALENPERYMPAIGFDWRKRTIDEMCQYLYTTMIVNYHHTGYSLGVTPEEALRGEVFPDIFATESGRKWWTAAAQDWRSARPGKFVTILDEEYEKAILEKKPPIPSTIKNAEDGAASKARNERRSHAVKVAGAGLAGALISAAVVGVKRKRW
jgi:Family of unknown function (DUF6082)